MPKVKLLIIHISHGLGKHPHLKHSIGFMNMLIRSVTHNVLRSSRCPVGASFSGHDVVPFPSVTWGVNQTLICNIPLRCQYLNLSLRGCHPIPAYWPLFLHKQRFEPQSPGQVCWVTGLLSPLSPDAVLPPQAGAVTACWFFNRLLMGSIPSLRELLGTWPWDWMKWKYHLRLYEPLYCSERPLFGMLHSAAESFAPPGW